MKPFTLDNPPDDADFRNPCPNTDPRHAKLLENSKSSEFRMNSVEVLASRCRNENEMTDVVFRFGWDFGWSYRECIEAIVDAGYGYLDPIKGAS